ncbi:hypothetical protein BDP27DRAFT_1369375 [Rhodocollybia butyracea]|uniref:Uncharacterized protein n=1 Tax=Rhodocollybia butyracea TaxID=206335 RepID=A0A9P5PEB0_9AGAR|nr:hypothetical protein BDP27DRAFT_1369375 [Rhodocollybia butyracea]
MPGWTVTPYVSTTDGHASSGSECYAFKSKFTVLSFASDAARGSLHVLLTTIREAVRYTVRDCSSTLVACMEGLSFCSECHAKALRTPVEVSRAQIPLLKPLGGVLLLHFRNSLAMDSKDIERIKISQVFNPDDSQTFLTSLSAPYYDGKLWRHVNVPLPPKVIITDLDQASEDKDGRPKERQLDYRRERNKSAVVIPSTPGIKNTSGV